MCVKEMGKHTLFFSLYGLFLDTLNDLIKWIVQANNYQFDKEIDVWSLGLSVPWESHCLGLSLPDTDYFYDLFQNSYDVIETMHVLSCN